MVSTRRIVGWPTKLIYKIISCNWKTDNSFNFYNAPCFKILTCDPNDDVIDNFASLSVGAANQFFTRDNQKQTH
jgi:hypothetical protein